MSSKSWLDSLPAPDPTMSKRSFITNITPLPSHVTREAALALLHNHGEMIRLNPMVIRHEKTKAPPNATLEEQVNCIWYLITDEINYLPGGAAKSEMSYKAGFYDLPQGLQTHCFAPGGVDLKGMWRVGGSMPGEKPEPVELGVAVPSQGLYMREDVEVRCNVFFSNFVKRNLKKSHAVLVNRLLKKVEDQMKSGPPPTQVSSSPTDTIRSTTQISPPIAARSSVFAGAPGTLSPPLSRQSSNTTPTAPPQYLSPQVEPCSCGDGGHQVMCPNYRYGAPPPRARSPAPSISSQHSQRPHADIRWPPQADRRPVSQADLYSPAGQHPESIRSKQPQSHAHVSHRAPIQQAKDNNFGRVVWKLPSGNSPSVAYRSPQLFGEQAELPGTTMSTERDEDIEEPDLPSYRSMSDRASLYSELDNTERAYWERGGGDSKQAPGDGGWI